MERARVTKDTKAWELVMQPWAHIVIRCLNSPRWGESFWFLCIWNTSFPMQFVSFWPEIKICPAFFFFFGWLVFWDRVSLYSPGCPGTHFVDQTGLELRNLLRLKVCATMPGSSFSILFCYFIVCVGMFWLHACLCITWTPGTYRGQKRALDSLELELQMVVSCLVGARNWTLALC
jgi:hypothetical protein